MDPAQTAVAVSVEEYLHNPDYDHCEYVDGEVVPKPRGTSEHGAVQGILFGYLRTYLRARKTGHATQELHCRMKVRGRTAYRLPDVAVVLGVVKPPRATHEGAPALVVEVRSDETVASMFRKMDEYFANGARLGWLVLPEERTVLVVRPGQGVVTLSEADTLDGGDLLPGFAVPVADLFD